VYRRLGWRWTRQSPSPARPRHHREGAWPRPPAGRCHLGNLSLLYADRRDPVKAEQFSRRALAVTEKLEGAESPAVAVVLDNLAGFLVEQRRLDEAAGQLERAIAILDKAGNDRPHPDVAQMLDRLATLYREMGRGSQADEAARRAAAIRSRAP
jgi:tetratricopeptide (TPR) repeat protein